MKLSDLPVGKEMYTQLSGRVLAVLVRRAEGWCVYVDAVPGKRHAVEWQEVATHGEKQRPEVAQAIAESLFCPGFEIDLPYAS